MGKPPDKIKPESSREGNTGPRPEESSILYSIFDSGGHGYVLFSNGERYLGVVHSPDCKKCAEKKEC